MEKSLLFTCMGTSDPVRGYRDGPMLHILRKYRPDKVIIFLTKEAAALAQTDNRLQSIFDHMKSVWDNYNPAYEVIHAAIDDPSDLDAVAYPMEECLLKAIEEYPDREILLNLSSGTPQMKQVLTMLAADARYSRLRGIQVKNPEKAAGKSERTNLANYMN